MLLREFISKDPATTGDNDDEIDDDGETPMTDASELYVRVSSTIETSERHRRASELAGAAGSVAPPSGGAMPPPPNNNANAKQRPSLGVRQKSNISVSVLRRSSCSTRVP